MYLLLSNSLNIKSTKACSMFPHFSKPVFKENVLSSYFNVPPHGSGHPKLLPVDPLGEGNLTCKRKGVLDPKWSLSS